MLANSKTVLNADSAKQEIKQQVIRADQLIDYIKQANSERGSEIISEQKMEHIAEFFLCKHQENSMYYLDKYYTMIGEAAIRQPPVKTDILSAKIKEKTSENNVICPKCGSPMIRRKATKGMNAGKEFFGCSTYPQCRGIVNIFNEAEMKLC